MGGPVMKQHDSQIILMACWLGMAIIVIVQVVLK